VKTDRGEPTRKPVVHRDELCSRLRRSETIHSRSLDPLTHLLAGATIGWVAAGKRIGRTSLLIGGAAALLPDADLAIRSVADPLLAIEHHRGFTHSFLFVPLGGAIAAAPFLRGKRRQWSAGLMAGVLAYLSHVLLDGAATYGTQWFWPFSRYRVGLDVISIIDPLFTLIFLIGLFAALFSRRRLAAGTIVAALVWLVIGGVQRERALGAQAQLAERRSELPDRRAVFPTAGNTIVWRSIYETGGQLRIDRLRVPWTGRAAWAETDTVPLAELDEHQDAHERDRMRRDFERFAWFSDGWIARDPADATVIGDARYSLRADRYEPVWGIRFHPGGEPPVEWVDRSRGRDAGASTLWREITGRSEALKPLE
jgi:inner membrane protein